MFRTGVPETFCTALAWIPFGDHPLNLEPYYDAEKISMAPAQG